MAHPYYDPREVNETMILLRKIICYQSFCDLQSNIFR